MAQTFDVFVRNIDPEKSNDIESIKAAVCDYLSIEPEKLNDILDGKTDPRIFYEISAEQANAYQAELVKIGLICVGKPSVVKDRVGLMSIDEPFDCPKCGHGMYTENGAPPKECSNPKCGVIIAKYMERMERENGKNRERDRIKEELLRGSRAQAAIDKQRRDKEAEKKRLEDLKKDVMKEMGWTWKTLKAIKTKKKIILQGGIPVVILLLGWGGYMWWSSYQTPDIVGIDGKPLKPTGGVTAEKAVGQINNMLGSMGIDTSVITGSEATSSNQTSTISPQQALANTAAILALFDNSDLEWDGYLIQRINAFVAANALDDAYIAAKHIIDSETYINAFGRLLNTASATTNMKLVKQILSALENRISSLPPTQQATYFAQAGFEQSRVTGSNSLLERANTQIASLAEPENQLIASLRLGVYYAKLGNGDKANYYFGTINTLLEKVSNNADTQAITRMAVARAYYEVNNIDIANQWLSSINGSLDQLSPETFKEVIKSYTFVGDTKNAIALSAKKPQQQSELLYDGVQTAIKANAIANALTLTQAIKTPIYQALAYSLLASYNNAKAVDYLAHAEKALANSSPADNIMLASRLARHYSTLSSNPAQSRHAVQLFMQAEKQLAGLPKNNPQKDKLLAVVTTNYLYALQIDAAKDLLASIQSSTLKSELSSRIAELKETIKVLK